MRRSIVFCVVAVIAAQNAWATPKADSIVAFTGARTKLVWKRLPWCNDHYQPQSQTYMTANQSLIYFDTDVGTEKTLDKALADISYTRISRSGRWLTWNDLKNSLTYILDLTAASPAKRVLLDKNTCTYWCSRAFWVDQSTGTEYTFCLDNYSTTSSSGNGIYKVPLTSTGAADLGKATKITYQGGGAVDDAIGVSSDGKKLGGAFPWPNTMILDIATGQLDQRHSGQFGCQANVAPDNSYRFFHCLDEHQGVRMFDANLSTTNWEVDFLSTAPGWTCKEGNTDFAAPRWSNSLMYISNTYPMQTSYLDGDPPCWGGLNIWGLDSAGVRTRVRQDLIDNFFLAKFAADFKTIERTLMIASDIRYFQYGGDAWMANGVVAPGSVAAGSRLNAPAAVRSMTDGGCYSLDGRRLDALDAGRGLAARYHGVVIRHGAMRDGGLTKAVLVP